MKNNYYILEGGWAGFDCLVEIDNKGNTISQILVEIYENCILENMFSSHQFNSWCKTFANLIYLNNTSKFPNGELHFARNKMNLNNYNIFT